MPTVPCRRKPRLIPLPRLTAAPISLDSPAPRPVQQQQLRAMGTKLPALPLDELLDSVWATVPDAGFTISALDRTLTPEMQKVIEELSAGREDQLDALTCLVRNSWKPGKLWNTPTPVYLAYRQEGVAMISAVHIWASTCVGATNHASPDPRDTIHRSKGLAASSLDDRMTPCCAVVGEAFHVWGSAVAILDKFLHSGSVCFEEEGVECQGNGAVRPRGTTRRFGLLHDTDLDAAAVGRKKAGTRRRIQVLPLRPVVWDPSSLSGQICVGGLS